jgi:hypothetical protein
VLFVSGMQRYREAYPIENEMLSKTGMARNRGSRPSRRPLVSDIDTVPRDVAQAKLLGKQVTQSLAADCGQAATLIQ